MALDGFHYDISDAKTLAFCPLDDLSTDTKKMRAEQFIENLVFLQNLTITPEIRSDIHSAIQAIAKDTHHGSRTLTVFFSTVQNELVRQAVKYYTIDGTLKLLDAEADNFKKSNLQIFEMGWLLTQKSAIYIPILMYIFDQIESCLEESNGKKPTLIVLEEAWLYIGHEVFSDKLRDWLKTMRKKNARVVFVTQSLSDLYNPETKTLTRVTAAIMESCPTKIYLPNPKMEMETRDLYRRMGLNERQLELIEHIGIPKKHYYVVTPEGNRLIDLGFSEGQSIGSSFLGLSPQSGGDDMIACKAEKGRDWIDYWLKNRGILDFSTICKPYFLSMGCDYVSNN